ncbi:hypothetical protein KSF_021930 [Reticulibacter mediterranei]|uniref:Sucrase ferredoxin n=1 Tax=Reticulibacter mediterranei TaxID=2778369 RepID=A0A8J3IJX2_9CHLR|nr:sucrase ferredoxin [Reticulibacter mediterranei]GHO92145.1 hypothetical protein KSF_021930 [Reticulibacter mediterranei]
MENKHFCAHISRERQDPYIGLAAHAKVWVMLEYTDPWEWIAIYNNQLPEPTKTWLIALANSYATSQAITLFIRQHIRPLPTINCFVGITRPDREALYRFRFNSYKEVMGLDLAALEAGSPAYNSYLTTEPLYLVCTNGKHDMCCAKFGMPIHKEASRLAGEQVWHCSHCGGDQFAANLLCFPHGIYYSRVTVPEVATIIEADRQEQLYLEKCRGRSCYPPSVQAAEYYLRKQTGIYDLNAFRWLDTTDEDNGNTTVRFQSTSSGIINLMTIRHTERETNHAEAYRCDNTGKLTRQEFQLVQIEQTTTAYASEKAASEG